jgi:hypothetical protein
LAMCGARDGTGVRVNAVNPGVTVTNLTAVRGWTSRVRRVPHAIERDASLGRPGCPEEIAEPILFLARSGVLDDWRDGADRRRPSSDVSEIGVTSGRSRTLPTRLPARGLRPSTNTSLSRSASVRTAVNPPALNAGPDRRGDARAAAGIAARPCAVPRR